MEFSCPARRPFHDIAYGDWNGDLHDQGSATALVSDIHVAEVAYTPYVRPPQDLTRFSAIPRGLKSFVVRAATLAAKPVNDDLLLTISWTLPAGFGYILNELHVNIIDDRAIDFRDDGIWRIGNTTAATQGMNYRYPIPWRAMSQAAAGNDVRGTAIPAGTLLRTPIIPGQGATTNSLSFTNSVDTVAAAGTVNAVISFWEYDLEQIQYFAAHSAVGVFVR